MFTCPITRIEEYGSRRRWSCERPVVAHISPQPTGDRLALRQHRHRGVVAVNALGRHHVCADQRDEWREGCGASPDPVGEGGDIEIDTFAGIGIALSIERLVVAELAGQY